MRDLKTMRLLATGALVLVVVGMCLSRFLESQNPLWGYIRAFCEAATVGALADWFAVVALFRHPAGIPIPHTAILPNNKARVAESLAAFIENSFLTEDRLGPRFRGLDYAGFASDWLTRNADSLADHSAGLIPRIIASLPDSEMSAMLANRAKAMLAGAELGPLAGAGLGVLLQGGRDREIYRSLLRSAEDLIVANREVIRKKIQEEIPLSADMLRGVPLLADLAAPGLEQIKQKLSARVADKTIEKVQAVLAEAEFEPEHVLWQSFDARLRTWIEALESSPEMAEKIAAIQGALASDSAVDDFATATWLALKAFVAKDSASPDSAMRAGLRDAMRAFAAQLSENTSIREPLNAFIGDQALCSIMAARTHIRELVISTVLNWDSKEMADRLEQTVGTDLQFIRLNGTIIGGLVGLALHAGFTLLGK